MKDDKMINGCMEMLLENGITVTHTKGGMIRLSNAEGDSVIVWWPDLTGAFIPATADKIESTFGLSLRR